MGYFGNKGRDHVSGVLDTNEWIDIAQRMCKIYETQRFSLVVEEKNGEYFLSINGMSALKLPDLFLDAWETMLPEYIKRANECPVPTTQNYFKAFIRADSDRRPKTKDYYEVLEDGSVESFFRNDGIIAAELDVPVAFSNLLYKRFSGWE